MYILHLVLKAKADVSHMKSVCNVTFPSAFNMVVLLRIKATLQRVIQFAESNISQITKSQIF